MFTGIIEELGTITRIGPQGNGFYIRIEAQTVLEGTRKGDSISINGTCLTVTDLDDSGFTVGLAPETISRTNLVHLRPGDTINLERSATPSTRLGGHIVQGHVDAVGTVVDLRPDKDSLWVTVAAPEDVLRYVVSKGYVALDGVSLTVVDVFEDRFTVVLVAFTRRHITLGRQPVGYKVNIEVDVLGKYVEKMLQSRLAPSSGLTNEKLSELGYT
jgi:riboflavin synthase